MPPQTYLVGGMQLFTCLQPLNFVTRHAYVLHMPEPVTGRILCHLDYFLPFYPHNNPENQNFENMKKKSTNILPFSLCVP